MLNNLRKHRGIIGTAFVVQAASVWLLLASLGTTSKSIKHSLIATTSACSSLWPLLTWTWLIAVGLGAVSLCWSNEMGERAYLEVWRHPSYGDWFRRKLMLVAAINVGLSVATSAALLVLYPGETLLAFSAAGLLHLYGTCLSLLFVGITMMGLSVAQSFVSVLSLHVMNIYFDGLGWPNTVQYFTLADSPGVESVIVAVTAVVSLAWLMVSTVHKSGFATRERESL